MTPCLPETEDVKPDGRPAGRGARRMVLRACAAALVLVALLALARSRVGWVLVVGESMQPTFQSGELLLVDRWAYQEAAPDRGDIIVARFRSEFVVKRVVGLPGDTVEVADGAVRIDGQPAVEDYPTARGGLVIRPGFLYPDRYAVLGDNRDAPEGELFFAVIPQERVYGRVVASLRFRPILARVHHGSAGRQVRVASPGFRRVARGLQSG